MKKKTRSVNFYEMSVVTLPAGNVTIEPTQNEFQSILNVLGPFFKKRRLFGSGASAFELVDCKIDEKNIFLLINKVNPDLPDIGFYKTSNGARRTPAREKDEHREQSAHIMIEPRDNSNSARVKITTGAGVSANKIKKIFSDVYAENKEEKKLKTLRTRTWPTQVEEKDGETKQYNVNHSFMISVEPSELLTDILDHNTVLELDLVDGSDISFDGTDLTLSKRTFTVTGKIPKNVAGLRALIEKARNGKHNLTVDQLRIVYSEEESDEALEARIKNQNSGEAKLDARKSFKKYKTVNAVDLEKAFTRSDVIYLDNDHSETQITLSNEVMSGLKLL